MKLRTSLVTVIMLAAISTSLHAASGSPSRSKNAWTTFLSSEGAGWDVRWNRAETSPEVIRPARGAKIPAWHQDRTEAVNAFFARHAALFELDTRVDELRAVGERSHNAITHVRAQQFYRGVPVRGGEYMVSVGPDGDPRFIAGAVYPRMTVGVRPTVAVSRAVEIARRQHRRPVEWSDARSRLMVDPGIEGGRLVYEVVLVGKHDTWEFIVDATEGAVLTARDLTLHANGCGRAYPRGPFDPDSALIVDTSFEITQHGILKGPRVEVALVNGQPLTTFDLFGRPPCSDFRFYPSAPGFKFEQVNAYYHLDWFIGQYLPSLGFPGFGSAVEVVLRPGCEANAVSWSNPPVINLGYDCDTALNPDAVFHEATHHVMISFGVSQLGEGGSMFEGWADYLACAANNDPLFAELIFARRCDNDRSVYNYQNFPNLAPLGVHEAGKIWSGTLWDLRLAIGAEAADSLALETMFYLPSEISYSVAGAALVQADYDHHAGAHMDSIAEVCQLRGFDPQPIAARIGGPALAYPQESITYVAEFPGGRPTVTYHWTAVAYFENGQESLDLGTASQASVSTGNALAVKLRLDVTDGLGAADYTYQWIHVCQSQGTGNPFSVHIGGGSGANENGDYDFFPIMSGGACLDSLSYTWERDNIAGGGFFGELIGTGPTVATQGDRNFDLRLRVTGMLPGAISPTGEDVVTVSIPGIPVVTIAGPPVLGLCEADTFFAVVGPGDAPQDYAWTLNSVPIPENAGHVIVSGTGGPMQLCLVVTTVTNHYADQACVTIGIGGPCDGPLLAPVSVGRRGETIELVVNAQGDTDLSVRVFDIAGREVGRVFDGMIGSGPRTFTWPVSGRQPGVYFIRAAMGNQVAVKRVLVMK